MLIVRVDGASWRGGGRRMEDMDMSMIDRSNSISMWWWQL